MTLTPLQKRKNDKAKQLEAEAFLYKGIAEKIHQTADSLNETAIVYFQRMEKLLKQAKKLKTKD